MFLWVLVEIRDKEVAFNFTDILNFTTLKEFMEVISCYAAVVVSVNSTKCSKRLKFTFCTKSFSLMLNALLTLC